MKSISHTELEALRQNVAQWVSQKQQKSPFFSFGYAQALRLAINHFHKTNSASEARAHLLKLLDKHLLNDPARRPVVIADLESYLSWNLASGLIFVERRARISFQLASGVILGGIIGRIDIDVSSGAYQATLLGEYSVDWISELRMPVIQRAIAHRMKRDESEVLVGVQRLSGQELKLTTYSMLEIEQALAEASDLTAQASKLLL